ncbi:ATP-dependent RecD-like DNA helicase [Variovorax sp. dw_308]|uniref:ATP-dependent DNA helicase n=1 Tax=Variovorax sp. dw_308 TaxID=2721546 RepID=UPI001C447013
MADEAEHVVVRANALTLGEAIVQPGQCWNVSGKRSSRQRDINGYSVTEMQIDATRANLLRPVGEHIVTFLADNPAFAGVGRVKAHRLWEALNSRLYEVLESGDVSALRAYTGPEVAALTIAAWAQFGDTVMLQWLRGQKLDAGVAMRVIRYFGRETAEKLEEDPYRLLSFRASWREVDRLARECFGVALDDPRRLAGAIEEACYRMYAAGHTSVLGSKLLTCVQGFLGSQSSSPPWRALVSKALETGLTNGGYVVGAHGVQPLGALVMERAVSSSVALRLEDRITRSLLEPAAVDALLREYEATQQIDLSHEQRAAVHLAVRHRFALVIGGAGVGTTTILRALYAIYDAAGVAVVQLALASRAAIRMQESTGRSASTIASFLRSGEPQPDAQSVVVIDEASTVDLFTMGRLCDRLGPAPRILLVGDTAQPTPVGPGLVLHALARVDSVPSVRLLAVTRRGECIASAAQSIRRGSWPLLSNNSSDAIAFIRAGRNSLDLNSRDIAEVVIELYGADPQSTQILCARRNSFDGTKAINHLCQARRTKMAAPVMVWSNKYESFIHTGLHLGDPVLCTRNLWDRGLQDGSLGRVVRIEKGANLQAAANDNAPHSLAWIEWDDGVRRPLVEEMLDDIELGYAITAHKAQGSQWPRVIVPLTSHRLLDRTLIYTAVTRAQRQVLLVGDEVAARAAVQASPRASTREVALDLTLMSMLKNRR